MESASNISGALVPVTPGGGWLFTPPSDEGSSLAPANPFGMEIVLVEQIRISGTTHVKDIDARVATIAVGSKLDFRRQPDNPYDKWAILVLTPSGEKLGYVSVEVNEIIARLMDGGKRVFGRVLSLEKKGSWNKIEMEVVLDD